MIKKWSYVAAAMLTVASGMALTSCIDNDEPYGIEQIRLATASLLEAKKSAVNAEQAAKEAEVEIERIKAEVAKLEAENQKILNEAEAKIKEAQAKAIEAEAAAKTAVSDAEAQRLLAEAAKAQAEADNIRAQTDIYIATQNAHINELIAQADVRVKKAQLEYETTLYYFEQEKAKNAGEVTSELYKAWESAFAAYINYLGEVNNLTKAYQKAVEKQAKAAVDLEYNETTGKWESNHYADLAQLKKNVADAQNDVDQKNEKIAEYQEFIANLQNITTTDLYQLYAKYEAEAKANDAAMDQAEADKAVLAAENKDLLNELNGLQAQVDQFMSKDIEIPAYTWDPAEIDEAAFASVGITESQVIVPERVNNKKTAYSLNDLDNYDNAVTAYENQINVLKNYLLDANDVAWTQARINEMKNLLKQQQADFNEAKTNWENAKKAYNMGQTPDFSVIPMEAEVEAAVADLKAAVNTLAGLRQTYVDAYKAYDEAVKKASELQEAYDNNPNSAVNKLQAAYQAHTDALAANDEAYDNAIDAAQAAYVTATAAKQNDVNAKQRDEDTKYRIYMATLAANGGDETVKAVADAKKAYEDAQAATTAAATAYADARDKALTAQHDAELKAEVARINANKKADDALAKAEQQYADAAAEIAKDPAAKDYLAALEAEDAAGEALTKAAAELTNRVNQASIDAKYNDLDALCEKQSEEVGGWDYQTVLSEISNALAEYAQADKDDEAYLEDITEVMIAPAQYEVGGSYVNVKAYLVNMSQIAYGYLGWNYDVPNGQWDIDKAFLIDAADITVEMVNEYIKELYPELPEFNYYTVYNQRFGLYGDILYTQNRIDVATAMINNQKLLSESIEPLQAGLDALEESKEAAEKELDGLKDSLNDKQAEWDALEADIDTKIGNLQSWKSIYEGMLSSLSEIIYRANESNIPEGTSLNNSLISTFIEKTIEHYDDLIKTEQKNLEDSTAQLDKATYQLQQYLDNEGVFTANPYDVAVAYAKAKLDAAEAWSAFLKARADELEAEYKAAK